MANKFTIVSEDELFKVHAPGESFKVHLDGDQLSYLGKVKTAYTEWLYGRKEGGKLVSYTIAWHSEAPLLVEAEGKRAAVSMRRTRVYVAPALEKEFKPGDKAAPEVVAERMAEEKKGAYVAEYRLEAGKTYEAVIAEETYRMPPPGPGKPPATGKKLVLRISDKPFKDGEPQVEPTPVYKGWMY